jgi:hypothetical protein
LRGHGGIGFIRAVHARRAHETSVRDWGCGISPRALRVPAPSSDFSLGEAEELDEREEGDDVWVPPLSGCGEGRSWLGRPTCEQA